MAYTPAQLGITPPKEGFQTGGWYLGRQYWNGTLSDPGQIHPESNQAGAGGVVSQQVIAQTNPANVGYIQEPRQQAGLAPAPAMGVPESQPVTPQPMATPQATTGIPGISGISTPEKINLPELYQNLYASSGISGIESQLSEKTKAYNEAVAKIKDNPYLSEATMTGRLSKLDAKFNADALALKNDITTKKADIETQLNLQTKQFDINSEVAKNALNQLNTLLNMGALDNASGETIASLTRSTGISSDLIYSAISYNKAKNVKERKTDIHYSTNDAGVVTATVLDQTTGEVISQKSLGSIGNIQGDGAGLTVSQTNALSEYLAQVPSYTNREDALKDLEKYKSAITVKIGETGYKQILNEVDRIFPQQTSISTPTTQQSGGLWGTVKSFFSNLFGK